MKVFQQFDEKKKWYKANFHAHSARSDGRLTPEEMVRLYKEQGYSILALSEHETYTDTREFDTEDMIVYPAIERSINLPEHETFHIHGIADYGRDVKNRCLHDEVIPVPDFCGMEDVQKIIDELKERGNFVMLNHPYWSFNTFEHLGGLTGYDFVEIFNFGAEIHGNLGDSEAYCDELWKKNFFLAVAADDNHNSNRYKKGIDMWDSFGGFTMLQLDEFSRRGISDALKKGAFYASAGPEIYQFSLCGNTAAVKCSEVKTIAFKAWPRRGYCIHKEEGGSLTEASYTLRGEEKWIRVKCIDEQGRAAWSNPIYIE